MQLALTPEQERVRDDARREAESICAPGAADRDLARAFPKDEVAELARQGWLGIRVDEARGGMGLDSVVAAWTIAEISRACASIGLLVGFHSHLFCETIARHAAPSVCKSYLPGLARGELFGAVALSDFLTVPAEAKPAAAVLTDEGYRITGTKPFVPGAVGANLFLVYAHASEDNGEAPRERLLFLIPRDTPGLSVGEAQRLVGVRAAGTASLHLDNCLVSPDLRIGGGADARRIAKEMLAAADLVVAAQAVGIGTAALQKTVARASERDRRDTPVGNRQSVQFMVADMLVQLEAARLLMVRAAHARTDGAVRAYEAAQAKSFAGKAAVRIADMAIQVLGGDGSLADHGIERHWRDAKTCELNPSTREATDLLVARHLLEETA